MTLTPSKLRQNIYHLLQEVAEKGVSLTVVCKGKRVRIVPAEPVDKFKMMKKRRAIKGSPQSVVHLDWSKEWKFSG